MKQRIITALIIIAFVLPPLIYGGVLLYALIFLIGAVGLYEAVKINEKKFNIPLYISSFLYFLLVVFNANSTFIIGLTIIYLMLICLLAIISKDYQFEDISLVFVLAIILALSSNSVIQIYSINSFIMLFIVIANYVSDTGAFFVGSLIGKHKLNERISPKKTIEGSIGGWIIAAAVSFAFGYYFLYLPSVLSFAEIIVLALLLPIVGQIGDLAFSLIKRNYNIKDFGNIFPGHGGMLDRVDSLLFCLCFYLAVMSIQVVFI